MAAAPKEESMPDTLLQAKWVSGVDAHGNDKGILAIRYNGTMHLHHTSARGVDLDSKL